MKRLAALLALNLAACASGPGGGSNEGPRLRPAANPSAVIAAELAFNRLAQEKGQWTAFRETAASEAEMFVPQRVRAADWLKGRADPPIPVKWQPRTVWSSCDGSYAVTHGDWERPGSTGSFTTVWQRQKDGSHKWLLDMSLISERSSNPADMIEAIVADCSKGPPRPAANLRAGEVFDMKSGKSTDGSLEWVTIVMPNGARSGEIMLRQAGGWKSVLQFSVPAG